MIEINQIDDKTIKSLLIRECEEEGLDHKDFKVNISSRKTRRRGTHFSKWDNFNKKYHYIIIYEKTCKTLGILLKVFRHELLHSKGISHKDMIDVFQNEIIL